MEQNAPLYRSVDKQEEQILKSLGPTKGDILKEAPISLVNTGNSFVIVPVKSVEILKK